MAGILVMTGIVSVGLDGWEMDQFREVSLSQAVKGQTIKVHILEHPLIYKKETNKNIWGQDYEILKAFAAEKGLNVQFVSHKKPIELLQSYHALDGDMWVHRWPTFHNDAGDGIKGPDMRESNYVGLCSKKVLKGKSTAEATQLKYVIRDDDIQAANPFFMQLGLNLAESHYSSMNWGQLAGAVRIGKIDCIVAEEEMAGWLMQRYSFLDKTPLQDNQGTLSWWIHPSQKDLASLLHVWYHRKLRENAFMFLSSHQVLYSTLVPSDLRKFNRSIVNVLPKYQDAMESNARKFEIPWQLVAAVAYQESHWDESAASYTGVKGLMQLTAQTAEAMGIEDREDPEQSILGGTKYLAGLFKRTSIESPLFDRLALTLAAYNLGSLHVMNLQKMAVEKGLDPWRWNTIKKLLPELSSPEYKERFANNGARGYEALDFVERTLSFYHVLASI